MNYEDEKAFCAFGELPGQHKKHVNRTDEATREDIDKRLERLDFLAGHIGAKSGTSKAGDWSEFYMRIPADPNHDADLIMGWAAQHIEALQQQVERLTEELAEARGLIAEIDHFVTAQSNQHPKLLADLAEEPQP